MDSSPKKLDVVDKWRARMLFRDSLPATDSWAKRMERQMAVFRVCFPFLTEKQLRGKAWTACGLHSLMGELPRSGLSPKVKREFMKQGRCNRFTMSPKATIKKESGTSEKKGLQLPTYSCALESFESFELLHQNPLNYLNSENLLPVYESATLSVNDNNSMKKRQEKRKLKPKKVDFKTPENSPLKNVIVPEISQASWKEMDTELKVRHLYCSQIPKGKITVEQGTDKFTEETISECSTASAFEFNEDLLSTNNETTPNVNFTSDHQNSPKPIEEHDISQQIVFSTPCTNTSQNSKKQNDLLNVDSDATLFTEYNLPPTPRNYWSQPTLNAKEKSANLEKTKTISFKILADVHQMDCDETSSEKQQVLKISSASHVKKNADSLSRDINNEGQITEGFYQSENVSQDEGSTPFILSQNYSLPSTPQEPFENQPLLSNFCCEYSKACSREEYQPVPYINTRNIVKKLKKDFDKIIPPDVSLTKYFEAREKSFKQIQSEVQQKVNDIIFTLEEDESA